jgi:putative transposase
MAMFKTPAQFIHVAEKIECYRIRDRASIHAYVIMPNHFHLLISIPEGNSISTFMRDLKKRIAYEYFENLGIVHRPFWQSRFDDLLIYTEEQYRIKFNYIHNNPVKAGLVQNMEDWEYSSAGYYTTGRLGIISVTPVSLLGG